MLLGKAQEARQRRLCDCHEVGALRDVLCGTLELVEQCRARRARALRERQKRSLATLRPWPLVAGVAREHHAVDHQRVHAGREELREPHVGRCAVRTSSLEDVVLRDDSTGRELTPGRGHGLHGAAQPDLLLEQPIARRPVLRWLSRKPDGHAFSSPLTRPLPRSGGSIEDPRSPTPLTPRWLSSARDPLLLVMVW